jgi:DNA-binding PadR family transcriptional regulator
MRTYYPLSDEGRAEYEQWRRQQDAAEGENGT